MARNYDPELAVAVRERREALGLSPEMLAIESDGLVAANTIRSIERGKAPNVTTLRALAKALKTTPAALLGEPVAEGLSVTEVLPGWLDLPSEHRHVLRDLVGAYSTVAARREAERPAPRRRVSDELTDEYLDQLQDRIRAALTDRGISEQDVAAAVDKDLLQRAIRAVRTIEGAGRSRPARRDQAAR